MAFVYIRALLLFKLLSVYPSLLCGVRISRGERAPQIAETGAAGLICYPAVSNLPNATSWEKFGWGGIPIGSAASQLVALVLSVFWLARGMRGGEINGCPVEFD